MMESALYEGAVWHRRTTPPEHAFSRRLLMLYLDLAELDRVFEGRWLWGVERRALASFRRADHLGDPAQPLADSVRDLVEVRSGRRPRGALRLLTHLRYAGYVFNPVSFHYCFAPSGELEAVVGDITNTPWNERHRYVFARESAEQCGGALSARVAKRFHVSPFLPMEHDYRFTFEPPGEELAARVESFARGERVFEARLALRRREITGASLARALARYPLMTAQVIASIYWQAFRLRRKGAREYPHPAEASVDTDAGAPAEPR
ncbi:MAG TPA: DUF1365 domain-containing protein [Myxococcota bacterium]|nr:DUF1365 domain-containing protein [Myxococcota bacterium]